MKKIIVFLTLILSVTLHAQTAFEKGNFVNKQNQVVECLIKNYDWASIPKQIEFKTGEEDVVETISAENIASFYIYETSHMYKTFDVPVVGIQKGDVFVKSGPQLLRVLVEGKASLLKNNDGIYFLHFEGEPVKPLIYKKYIYNDVVEENVSFRLELYNALTCESFNMDNFKKLRYADKQLIIVVNEYNKCQGGESKSYTDKKAEAEFNIKLVAGINFYAPNVDLEFTHNNTGTKDMLKIKGNSETNFIVGFEAEAKLPFNHKKWSVFIVPTYNRQRSVTFSQPLLYLFSTSPYQSGYKGDVYISNYSYIEIPLGLRYHFILNKNSSINLSVAYGMSIGIASNQDVKVLWDRTYGVYYKNSDSSTSLLRLGAAYTFKDKYSVGINYYAFKYFPESNTNGAVSLLLGYKIF